MKPVVFTKLAQREVDTAAAWYEREREGVGQQFYDRVQEAAEKIQRAPEGFQERYKGVRRAGLRQFTDWGLWYKVLPDNSVVIGCLSARMNPVLAKERATGITPIRPPEP